MPAHLHDTLPFLLHRVAGLVAEEVNITFRGMGLNLFSARVLILLLQEDASTVGELADKGSLDQSTLSHILRRLQAGGLLQKQRADHDNRTVIVTLTDDGRAAADACWTAVISHDALLRKGLKAQDVKLLKDLLSKLYANAPAFRLLARAAEADAAPRAMAVREAPRTAAAKTTTKAMANATAKTIAKTATKTRPAATQASRRVPAR